MRSLIHAAIAALSAASAAQAQNVINQNTTIHDKLCVGSACANTESYSSTVLKLKDPLVRVYLDDTSSSSGSAPYHDWTIIANDYYSGGDNYLSLANATTGRRPFTIMGTAPDSALVIDWAGRLGVGTAIPWVDIHIINDIPRISLQDAMTGMEVQLMNYIERFMVQINSSSTSGVQFPFMIFKDAEDSVVVIRKHRLGVGTTDPQYDLHVASDTAGAAIENTSATTEARQMLHLLNNGTTYFTLEDSSIPAGDYSGRAWNFQNQNGTFRVTTAPGGAGEIEMLMEPDGDMHIKGQLYTGTGGTTTTCASGCDAVLAEGYDLPSLSDQMAAIREHGHLPAVGPTPEDGPHNLSQMVGGTLNELEKAYLYIGRLGEENAELRARLTRLEEAFAARP